MRRLMVTTFAFALTMMALPALAQHVTFSGNVTYRERIALPPGAQLNVTLVELPHATPVAGASAKVPATGGAPLAFELHVRRTLRADTTYGLIAEISAGNGFYFRNPTPVAVDPASPAAINILVRSAPAPKPVSEPDMPLPPASLTDISWTVTSIGGRPVSGTRPITLSIGADLAVGGNGGCNNYFTEASFETDLPLAFGPIAGTRMACEPTVMAQEARFFAALGATAGYLLEGDTLKLVDAAGVPLLGLIRAP